MGVLLAHVVQWCGENTRPHNMWSTFQKLVGRRLPHSPVDLMSNGVHVTDDLGKARIFASRFFPHNLGTESDEHRTIQRDVFDHLSPPPLLIAPHLPSPNTNFTLHYGRRHLGRHRDMTVCPSPLSSIVKMFSPLTYFLYSMHLSGWATCPRIGRLLLWSRSQNQKGTPRM